MKNNKKLVTLSVFMVSAVACLCFAGLSPSKDAEPVADTTPETIAHKSGLLVERNYDDLLQDAPVIVTANVTDVSDSFEIMPVFGGTTSIFTDYTIEVREVLRGDVAADDTLTVRLEGGQTDERALVVDEAPALTVGDELLLFLYQPNMGGAYNTEGDYYYILGLEQGAFYAQSSMLRTQSMVYENTLGTAIDLDALKADILSLSNSRSTEIGNEDRVYEEFLANQQKNLENGFITQEEYDTFLAEANEYATIIR